MYRLTITETDLNSPLDVYIVRDFTFLHELTEFLKQYRTQVPNHVFQNYDIIKYDEILVDSYELDNIDFNELEENDD